MCVCVGVGLFDQRKAAAIVILQLLCWLIPKDKQQTSMVASFYSEYQREFNEIQKVQVH